jgi:hypothetical protein
MLAVIQHQQQLLPGQHPRQHLRHRDTGLLPHPQRRRHHRRDLRRVPHRGQLGQPRPSANRAATARATWPASRVLPTPPGPVTVTSRCSPSRPATSRAGPARPMKLVSTAGKPCTPPAAADSPTPVP